MLYLAVTIQLMMYPLNYLAVDVESSVLLAVGVAAPEETATATAMIAGDSAENGAILLKDWCKKRDHSRYDPAVVEMICSSNMDGALNFPCHPGHLAMRETVGAVPYILAGNMNPLKSHLFAESCEYGGILAIVRNIVNECTGGMNQLYYVGSYVVEIQKCGPIAVPQRWVPFWSLWL